MATVDRLKEEIGVLKLFIGALIAIAVSLIAWLGQHYGTANHTLVVGAIVATLLSIGLALWTVRLTYGRIQRLEDL